MKAILFEAAAVVAAGAIAGLGLHAVRDDGVRLGEAPPPSGPVVCTATGTPAAPPRWITIEDAQRLLEDPTAVFVDSRPRAEYVEGHVAGAINLPRDEPWSPGDMALVRGARTVVSYCDGSDACACSSGLADALTEAGIRDVRVLEGGAAMWLERGLPAEGGL